MQLPDLGQAAFQFGLMGTQQHLLLGLHLRHALLPGVDPRPLTGADEHRQVEGELHHQHVAELVVAVVVCKLDAPVGRLLGNRLAQLCAGLANSGRCCTQVGMLSQAVLQMRNFQAQAGRVSRQRLIGLTADPAAQLGSGNRRIAAQLVAPILQCQGFLIGLQQFARLGAAAGDQRLHGRAEPVDLPLQLIEKADAAFGIVDIQPAQCRLALDL
ncbi:hypothetical protein D9M68_543970 [compost metagenome]